MPTPEQSKTPESNSNAQTANSFDAYASVVSLKFARQLEIQRDEARKREVACVWCGFKFESDIQSQAEHLYQHAKICEKHPIRKLEEELTNYKAVAEKLAEAGRPISQMGIPKGSEHDDCKYQVAFYDCPPDFVLWEDGMGHALSVGDCRIANEALAEYSKLTANQQEVHP